MNAQDNVAGNRPIERVAVFGGTFDPPHLGHLRLAESVLTQGLADTVLFVPAGHPPHKPHMPYSSYDHRFRMTALMIAGKDHMRISDIERPIDKSPSYTLDTMRKLRDAHPEKQYILLIGADSLLQLHTWHDAAILLDEFSIIGCPRPGCSPTLAELEQHWPSDTAQKLLAAHHSELPELDASSTNIRERLSQRQDSPYLLPEVRNYIHSQKLYLPKPNQGTSNDFLLFLMLCAGLFLWINLIAYWGSDVLLFPVPKVNYTEQIQGYLRIPVNATESLAAVTIPQENPKFHALYFHGNGEDISHNSFPRDAYGLMDIQPWIIDYRGYGLSDGSASARNLIEDAEACWRYLTDSQGIPPEKIILHGRSLGSAPATYLAAHHPNAGLIVESGFVSAFRVVTTVPIFPLDKLKNGDLIGKVKSPKLIIHGTEDGVVPFYHGKKLLELADSPKAHCWFEGKGHNDLPRQAVWQQIFNFVRTL